MASTFTSNTGIEKPGSGEQAGTWGTTTNTNFDIIDQAVHGQVSIAVSGSFNLTTSDGSTSDGVNPVIILTGSPSGTFEMRVNPTDQKKHYTIKNETNRACRVIYLGVTYSTSNGVEILSGASAAVTGDGGGGTNGKFKSLTPTTDVVNDTSPELGGDLQSNGNDIDFADNDKAIFGTGGDLEIYHDTQNSYIKDVGTGALRLLSNQVNLSNAGNTEDYIIAVDGAGVQLNHNNVKKIETTADGVDISGDISLTGGSGWRIHVDGNNELVFSYGTATVAKIGTNGAITSENDVTAFGTVA